MPSRAISRPVTIPAGPPRALSHPLPAGMRDLLPEEARRRRALARLVLDHFALHGYHLVTPPAFELAEVLERGLGALDPADVLRFVEPESGEVAALRPDMTPQIARMVATRLAREPRPIRLCYEGTIVRRRQGRARRHRQVPQAGVELYGAGGQAGDLEILRLSASVVRLAGLSDVVIDLGHASIARALLDALPAPLAALVGDALAHKDASRIGALLGPSRSPAHAALAVLADLHGGGPGEPSGEAIFARAEPLFEGTGAEAPLRELRALWEAARRDADLAAALRLDLGEVRGFAYYTGTIFHVLAPGPGEPIGAGGRYDDLLARFDAPMPAIGFALHLDSVAWAREAAGVRDDAPPAVLVAAGAASGRLVESLRAQGIAAAQHALDGAHAYAAAWRFTHVLTARDEGGALGYHIARVGAHAASGGAPTEGAPPLDEAAIARAIAGQP